MVVLPSEAVCDYRKEQLCDVVKFVVETVFSGRLTYRLRGALQYLTGLRPDDVRRRPGTDGSAGYVGTCARDYGMIETL